MRHLEKGIRFWLQICRVFKYPILLFITARVYLSFVAAISIACTSQPLSAAGNYVFYPPLVDPLGYYFLEPWNRWDTHWYLKIAVLGYAPDDTSMVFFPLYPLLIRVIGTLAGGQWLLAALIVSNLSALASYGIFYHLTKQQFGEEIARRTIAWLTLFPLSFYFFAGYTESLFLMLLLSAWQSARTRHWWLAGLFNGLGMLTRPPGVLFFIPLLGEFTIQYRRGQVHLKELLSLLFTSGIGIGYMVYLWAIFGDLDDWLRSVSFWHMTVWPGQNILAAVQVLLSSSSIVALGNLLDLFFALLFIILVIMGLFRLPHMWALCSVVIILPALVAQFALSSSFPLSGFPRYGLVAFPVFVTLASLGIRFRIVIIGLLLALQAIFVSLFVHWKWVA